MTRYARSRQQSPDMTCKANSTITARKAKLYEHVGAPTAYSGEVRYLAGLRLLMASVAEPPPSIEQKG